MEQFSGLLAHLPETIPAGDAARALDILVEYKKETELTRRDRAKVEASREIALAEITRRYDFYEKLFAAVFAERAAVTKKFFKVIERGIAEKNTDLVLAGLENLSTMVASSPLANLKDLR
jgi:hypothetical protein